MDRSKRDRLVARLRNEPEPQLVAIAEFLDGNDDEGSIGCNLSQHPGMTEFRDVLTSLAQRPDVEAVYAQIAEVDPGVDFWPFADTVFVVGSIDVDELTRQLAPLEPDEVGLPPRSSVPRQIARSRVLMAWWD